jgi:hypothetical protein
MQDIKLPKDSIELFSHAMNDFTSRMVSSSIFSKKIAVVGSEELTTHVFQAGYKPSLCYCDSCYGDFSGGEDE